MQMSGALDHLCKGFKLITGKPVFPKIEKGYELNKLYGLNHTNFVKFLPSGFSGPVPFPSGHHSRLFSMCSVAYIKSHPGSLIMTRNIRLLRWAKKTGFSILLETHKAEDYPEHFFDEYIRQNKHLVGIVVISPALKEFYSRYFPEEKILILEDGVNLDAYPESVDRKTLRQNLSFPQDKDAFTAVFTGHLYKDRGLEEIFQAAKQLPDMQFLIVGGWPEDVKKRQDEIEAMQLKNVTLTGFVDHQKIPDYQMAADVLLMPYSSRLNTAAYCSPLKLFEYMASNTPVIATRLPRVVETLNEDRGYLIDCDDAEAMVSALQHINEHPDEARNKARKARTFVEPFSWSQRAQTILDYFNIET